MARAICYGQRGEIRKRYREGQEDQLGSLGLVTNAVVLWNTLYMQEVLSWMRRNGEEMLQRLGSEVAACCCRYCCIWKQPCRAYCWAESYIFIKHFALKPGMFLLRMLYLNITFMEV